MTGMKCEGEKISFKEESVKGHLGSGTGGKKRQGGNERGKKCGREGGMKTEKGMDDKK